MSYSPSPYSPSPWGDQPASVQPAKPRRSLTTIFLILGVALLVPCVCCGGISLFLGRGVFLAVTERGNVQRAIHLYMVHMSHKSVQQAFVEFSARGQQQTSIAQLQQLVDGPDYAKFSGYELAMVRNINVSTSYNSNPNRPQGTVATVQGTILYEGGVTGTFQAVLEHEEGFWRIYRIDVSVPPSKVAAQRNQTAPAALPPGDFPGGGTVP